MCVSRFAYHGTSVVSNFTVTDLCDDRVEASLSPHIISRVWVQLHHAWSKRQSKRVDVFHTTSEWNQKQLMWIKTSNEKEKHAHSTVGVEEEFPLVANRSDKTCSMSLLSESKTKQYNVWLRKLSLDFKLL